MDIALLAGTELKILRPDLFCGNSNQVRRKIALELLLTGDEGVTYDSDYC
jgi:hypothetical protein